MTMAYREKPDINVTPEEMTAQQELVARLRQQHGWSQREVAAHLDLSESMVSALIVGRRPLGWGPLVRLALSLEEDPVEVLHRGGRHDEAQELDRVLKTQPGERSYLAPEARSWAHRWATLDEQRRAVINSILNLYPEGRSDAKTGNG